jgi:7-keto-8-aminopelargonate synthetase-like enzyme
MMLVDDAHAAGVLGRTGKGSLEHHRISRERTIQTITLSKAFGVFGGAVLGSRELRSRCIARSRSFIGSTPLPLPLAAAALVATEILAKGSSLRARLSENTRYVRNRLRKFGLHLEDTPGPIIQIVSRNQVERESFRKVLLREKIYPPFMNYPGGTKKGFFRFAISSEHKREQLDALVRALSKV